MEIETSTVTKYKLTKLDKLDPVTVICEDLGPRQGKIIIECFGESWSAYWGGMGSRNIIEFFCSCNEGYLANKLSSISSSIDDYEGVTQKARAEIIKLRKEHELCRSKARELWDSVGSIEDKYTCDCEHEALEEIFGSEWWYCIPQKTNHRYEYLCRIIQAVQEALKTTTQKQAA